MKDEEIIEKCEKKFAQLSTEHSLVDTLQHVLFEAIRLARLDEQKSTESPSYNQLNKMFLDTHKAWRIDFETLEKLRSELADAVSLASGWRGRAFEIGDELIKRVEQTRLEKDLELRKKIEDEAKKHFIEAYLHTNNDPFLKHWERRINYFSSTCDVCKVLKQLLGSEKEGKVISVDNRSVMSLSNQQSLPSEKPSGEMKIDNNISNDKLDVWLCECGAHIPVSKGSEKPNCEYCRRVKEGEIE